MADEGIDEPHEAFARALVALARQHKVGMFRGAFRLSITPMRGPTEKWNSTDVSIAWVEGRHGIEGTIELSAQLSHQIQEKIAR